MLLRAHERTLGLAAVVVALALVVTMLVHGPAPLVGAQGGSGTITLVDPGGGRPFTSDEPSRLLEVRPVFPVPGGDAQFQTVLSERENDGPWRVVRSPGPNGTTTFDYPTSPRVSPFSTFTYKAELQWRGSGGGTAWQPVATSEVVTVAWQAYRTRVMFKPEGNGQWRAVAATNGSLKSSWATMRLHQEGTATAKCSTSGDTNCMTGLLTTAQAESVEWYAQVESGDTPPVVKYRSENTPFTPIGYVPPAEMAGGCNPNQPSTSCQAGDPVNTVTGVYWDTFTDLSLSGRGSDHAVVRAYATARADQDGPFGYGWAAGLYGWRADKAPDGQSVTIMDERGNHMVFIRNPTGDGWVGPGRTRLDLADDGTGLKLTRRSDRAVLTVAASGDLTSVTDRNGETLTLTYAAGKLATVAGQPGNTLTYTWAGDHVTKVADAAGREVSYAYNSAGNLTSVDLPGLPSWTYTYDNAHRLLTKKDARDAAVVNVYDTQGRVTKQTNPAGRATTFVYSTPFTGGTLTKVTGPDGSRTDATHGNGLLIRRVDRAGTSLALTTEYGYDPVTLQRTMCAAVRAPLSARPSPSKTTGVTRCR